MWLMKTGLEKPHDADPVTLYASPLGAIGSVA